MNDGDGPVRRFHKKHGDDAILIDGTWYFSDGARRDNETWGLMQEPPTDPYELAKLKALYHEEVLERLKEQFIEQKQELRECVRANQREGWPAPDEQVLDQLRELKSLVDAQLKKTKKARRELDRCMPDSIRNRDRLHQENHANNEAFITFLNSLRI